MGVSSSTEKIAISAPMASTSSGLADQETRIPSTGDSTSMTALSVSI